MTNNVHAFLVGVSDYSMINGANDLPSSTIHSTFLVLIIADDAITDFLPEILSTAQKECLTEVLIRTSRIVLLAHAVFFGCLYTI